MKGLQQRVQDPPLQLRGERSCPALVCGPGGLFCSWWWRWWAASGRPWVQPAPSGSELSPAALAGVGS